MRAAQIAVYSLLSNRETPRITAPHESFRVLFDAVTEAFE
jgi:hypothetical protein